LYVCVGTLYIGEKNKLSAHQGYLTAILLASVNNFRSRMSYCHNVGTLSFLWRPLKFLHPDRIEQRKKLHRSLIQDTGSLRFFGLRCGVVVNKAIFAFSKKRNLSR
ncbi:MAG: hypothetical protein WCG27_10040, partial [Pseudomonadota bacterium]